MTSRESDLQFGLVALRMELVTREQLLEGVGHWLNDLDMATLAGTAPRSLPTLLLESGHLDPQGLETVKAAIAADGRPPVLESGVREELLALHPPGDLRAWLLGLTVGMDRPDAFHPVPRESRYELVREIARGGLGRVMEARDWHLEREVAVKLVLDQMPAEARERFVREARITARLDHPNIVPVYDFDELPVLEGGRRLMLCMKRVRGRDLGTLLHGIRRGDPDLAGRWSQARLLRVFQEICLGIAFAHSRGVLHRDLKPSNVMIGDYGETLIVDWGLAKEQGSGDRAQSQASDFPSPDLSPELTLEGEVLGTPLYMSPEQAAGKISELDARSDIFSLGGILYTILAYRPPFVGTTRQQVIESVLSGRVPPPSRVVEETRSTLRLPGTAGQESPAPLASLPEPVAPDLEAICLKALAHGKEDRYGSAMQLHDDIQLFLEGIKQRQREHAAAEEAVGKAKVAMERMARLREEARAAEEEATKAGKGVQPWEKDKRALWRTQDRAKALERAGLEAYAEADATLILALGHERDHREARRLRAELSWGKFQEAEEQGIEKEMLLHRRVVELYNDGPFDALLKGDGTLTVRTRAYPCRCLLDGRPVEPGEFEHLGYHMFSGRALDGRAGAEGIRELEPVEPVRLKVHGKSCAAEALTGADVWLYRYDAIDRRLIPTTPQEPATRSPFPAPLSPSLFAPDSPYRPVGPGSYLGRTPIDRLTLPMGSYLLLVAHEGYVPERVPVCVPRCGPWEQDVTLFRPEEIPAGFVPIPAGPFVFQGDPGNPYGGPAETKVLGDGLFALQPVTCGEYREFLNDLARTDPEQAARRVPRDSQDSGFYWPGPPYIVPTAAWLAGAPADLKARARRLQNSPIDWEEDWPVVGVSWEDAMAYCAWRRKQDGTCVVLPHVQEWEKSARGTDRRFFPWGTHDNPAWANGSRSHPGGMRPVGVKEFPSDESPYGIRGLGGNSRGACLNSPGTEYPGWREFRGGGWATSGHSSRASSRTGLTSRDVLPFYGIRLACAVRLSASP